MYTTSDLAEAQTIIDRIVQIHPPKADAFAEVTFNQKLNRLEELIDVLRYRYPEKPPTSDLDVFLPNCVFGDDVAGLLHFTALLPHRHVSKRHRPGALVLPLLEYLYNNPGNGRPVLHIIRDFVRHYHEHLQPGDFVRTRTGVLRVETTLRDAARILRWCGLLQYTRHEKMKTWRLSLLGILASSAPPTGCPFPEGYGWSALWRHLFINRLEPIRTMPALTTRLEAIVKALHLDWEKAEPLLKLTMETLTNYQRIVDRDQQRVPQRVCIAAVNDLLWKLNAAREAQNLVEAFDRRSKPLTRWRGGA